MTRAMSDAVRDTDQVCSIDIYGGYVPDPGSFDPYSDDFRKRKSFYRFSLRDRAGACYLTRSEDRERYMNQLRNAKSISDISESLHGLEDNRWLWIDVMISLSFDIEERSEDADAVSDADLWRDHLRPFAPWLRP